MSSPLVSIIVPVYNVEAYLSRCLESIAAQTFRDFECILVDDGSTDSSPALCDEWAQRDPRFRVLHQKNGGISAARNSGMDAAQASFSCVPRIYRHLRKFRQVPSYHGV